jgi:hypothetical protein
MCIRFAELFALSEGRNCFAKKKGAPPMRSRPGFYLKLHQSNFAKIGHHISPQLLTPDWDYSPPRHKIRDFPHLFQKYLMTVKICRQKESRPDLTPSWLSTRSPPKDRGLTATTQ